MAHDSDTTAETYGQLAGAHYGELGIPDNWEERLTMKNKISLLADQVKLIAMTSLSNQAPLKAC